MYQPHTIIYTSSLVSIVRHDGADYHKGVPFLVRANLLRYQTTLHLGRFGVHHINYHGRLNLHWANLNWLIWKRYWNAIKSRHTARVRDGGK